MTQAIELILAECLDAMADGSMSVADCLLKYPDEAERLEPLLLMAAELHTAPVIALRPAFEATAKVRLFDRLERAEGAVPSPTPQPLETADWPWWRRLFAPSKRPLWAAAAAMIVLLLWVGVTQPFAPDDMEESFVEASVTPSAVEVALAYWESATIHLSNIEQALAAQDTTTAVQTLGEFVAQVNQVQAAVQVIEDSATRKNTAAQIQSQLYSAQVDLAQLPPLGESDQPVVEAVNTIQQADVVLQMVIREETEDPLDALLLEGHWTGDSLMAVLLFAENGHAAAAETAAQQYIVQMNVLFDLLEITTSVSDVAELIDLLVVQQALLIELQEQKLLNSAVMDQLWQVWHVLTAQLSQRWPAAVAMLELTATPSLTPSVTPTSTSSMTPTPTLTPPPTQTPTLTSTPTATNTRWPTVTPSATAVPTVPPPPPPPP
ncbi:MAG: hypothetical protein KDE51_17830, partial [Anaerolineales bacterium]|nr:hypothetical protein [Anaerolineales bacterium]